MSTKRTDIKLPTVNDLFKTQETREDELREKIMDIPLSELYPFKNHPFQVKNDEELRELAKKHQTKRSGISRNRETETGGGYEILAGHRRKMASELAGLTVMPVVVGELARKQIQHQNMAIEHNLHSRNLHDLIWTTPKKFYEGERK